MITLPLGDQCSMPYLGLSLSRVSVHGGKFVYVICMGDDTEYSRSSLESLSRGSRFRSTIESVTREMEGQSKDTIVADLDSKVSRIQSSPYSPESDTLLSICGEPSEFAPRYPFTAPKGRVLFRRV